MLRMRKTVHVKCKPTANAEIDTDVVSSERLLFRC
jgi:hypothetical protein